MTVLHDITVDAGLFRNPLIRVVLMFMMIIAFAFGYLDLLLPLNFERLHIFFFNLTTGGFLVIYYSENRSRPSRKSLVFFLISIMFALSAFFEVYQFSVAFAIVLGIIVETVRQKKFSFFPWEFFRMDVPVSVKFHHASLLCLSMALFISSVVIMNDTWFHWFHFEKLTLNVFFLGYSFPVSLITLSIIFKFVNREEKRISRIQEDMYFWIINLGVITFFGFIIFELALAEVLIAFTLFAAVFSMLTFIIQNGLTTQQNLILKSGIAFLVSTAVTGVLYIILAYFGDGYKDISKDFLTVHAYVSLYGWNLSGMLVIIRWNDFPLKLNTRFFILFHWVTIAILPPLAKMSVPIAALSVASYTALVLYAFGGNYKRERIHD